MLNRKTDFNITFYNNNSFKLINTSFFMVETLEQSPVIVLPEDNGLIEKLKRKRFEYVKRVENIRNRLTAENSYWPQDKVRFYYMQTGDYHKLAVISELLENKSVETYDLSRKLGDEILEVVGSLDGYEAKVFIDNFNNASAVIEDYCNTGGKKVSRGTGLR